MIKAKITLLITFLAFSVGLPSEGHMQPTDLPQNNTEEPQEIEMLAELPETEKVNEVTSQVNEDSNKLEDIARSWTEAFYTSKEAAASVVKYHLAEDGRSVASRYIGFGFMYNENKNPGKMIITSIVPESPASKVLEVGDEFVSVNGVRVNKTNMGKLAFRGKEGEAVRAIIKRNGKTTNISVARGVIAGSFSKEQILNNIESQDWDDWAPIDSNIIEALSKENVVYILHWAKRKDVISELPFEAFTVTRFIFNDDGKIDRYASLSEDRFMLEQQGFKISR